MSDEPIHKNTQRPRPVVLMILDGYGIAPAGDGNAISLAKTPNFDIFKERYPVVTLKASGETVGLMWGEMGNSEVGHLTIGAGRVYYQALPRIEKSITTKEFFQNQQLLKTAEHVKKTDGTFHIFGLMSSGKVHAFNTHAYALLEFCKQQKIKKVAVHPILDGRDTLYNSGVEFIEELQAKMKELKVGKIATLSGRFYSMDRDNRWERTEKAYNAMVLGESEEIFQDPLEALKSSYTKEVFDEEFVPVVIGKPGKPAAVIQKGDAIVCMNFRPDRARQITKAFVLPDFQKFEREYIKNLHFTSMTEYEKGLPVDVLFPAENLVNTVSEVLSNAGLVQLHIAETEKYAHVTFFLNGMREQPFPNEDRVIIPSPKVPSYDEAPDMATREITDHLLKDVQTGNYDVMIVNYANPDMVSHTGDLKASIQAIETVDECVGKIAKAVLAEDGVVMITADHGNIEEVKNVQTGEMDKEHSTNPVPLHIIGNIYEGQPGIAGDVPGGDLSLMPPIGMLADIAPTMLKILGIEQPEEMTGTPLIE